MRKKVLGILKKYDGELFYTASQYFLPVVGLISSAIAAAFILPQDMGVLQSMTLLVPYLSCLQLGVISGVNRNVAFYKAQGAHEKVQSIVNTSFVVGIVVSFIGLMLGLSTLFYVTAIRHLPRVYTGGACLFITLLVFGPVTAHFDTTYRSGQEFKKLSFICFAEGVVHIAFSLLPIIIGYIGKVIADAVRALLRFTLLYKNQPIPATLRFSRSDYRELVATGFPMMIAGYLWTLLAVADQSLIAIRLGPEALGYYTLSRLILTAVQMVPVAMAVLLYPRAAGAYGRAKNNQGLRPFFWKAAIFNAVVLLPIGVVLFFAIDPFVRTFLPNYAAGIAAAKINILTCMTLVSQGPSIIIGVVKKNIPQLVVLVSLLGAMWFIGLRMDEEYCTLEYMAVLRFVCSFVYAVFTLGYSYWLTTRTEYNE